MIFCYFWQSVIQHSDPLSNKKPLLQNCPRTQKRSEWMYFLQVFHWKFLKKETKFMIMDNIIKLTKALTSSLAWQVIWMVQVIVKAFLSIKYKCAYLPRTAFAFWIFPFRPITYKPDLNYRTLKKLRIPLDKLNQTLSKKQNNFLLIFYQ